LWSYNLQDQFEEILLKYFTKRELQILKSMIEKKINCPWTTSIGRAFDAFAVLLGLGFKNTFEGELAIQMEYATRHALGMLQSQNINKDNEQWLYDFKNYNLINIIDGNIEITFESILLEFNELKNGEYCDFKKEKLNLLSLKFHFYLIEIVKLVLQSQKFSSLTKPDVFLTGGVFQNRLLTEIMVKNLSDLNYRVQIHKYIPPNDGGIGAGQIIGAILT
jgi:hydrogenase maturation protein HypF